MQQIKSVNDFVIRFANTNGTGSASANNLFAKTIFRMGIPVSPKNIFPSNIQGLPTWYEVRVNDKGYVGRRGGVDIMVAVNPQSIVQDIKTVEPGGYFIYDNTKPLDRTLYRDDITLLGIPLTDISRREYSDPRQRQLFKNVIYIGALAAMLAIEFDVLKTLVHDQFKGKEKLIAPNLHALELGYYYAQENFSCPLGIQVARREMVNDHILMEGNAALGLGAIFGGASVAAWYPITPSTSVVEQFEKYAKRLRHDPVSGKCNYAIVQAEDELAAIGMVIGASWNGARSFTATSGPGVSLMNEFLGLAYFAEVPAVLFDIQRAGPSTGMPTRSQQSDILLAAYASHGDTKHVLMFPATPKECFEMGAASFDLADRLQTPVILMSDLDLGMNEHFSEPLEWDDSKRYDRGKVFSEAELEVMSERYGRYLDIDGDGICYRTYPGTHPTKGAFFTRGSSRDQYAKYTESSDEYVENMKRLLVKWETAKDYVPQPQIVSAAKPTQNGMIYFGTTTASAEEALDILGDKGIFLDALRVRGFPFNADVEAFIENHDQIYVIEQNRDGQLRMLLINECEINPNKLKPLLCYDGLPVTARWIVDAIIGGGKDNVIPFSKEVTA
ncbi:MAG: 2-oxoacid:acceptor oxidoreductase subunit alpha [Porticoccus sp.]|nr:2-oxoacid:acceptor oxidoreductase subunit alpha [Porticoccus sp.]